MGMFDTIIVLDELSAFACPHGHAVCTLQTKHFVPAAMDTYLVHAGRLWLAEPHERIEEEGPQVWRIDGVRAVRERQFALSEVPAPRTLTAYNHCDACEPVLVRSERATFSGDVVGEQHLSVEFRLTLRPGEPLQVERTSGTREDLFVELREEGIRALRDDDPLALAHRELLRAQAEPGRRRRFRW